MQRLLIEAGSAIERELYLGLVLDRATAKIVFMASQAGGMEIEKVAHDTPELIFKETIEPAIGSSRTRRANWPSNWGWMRSRSTRRWRS